MGFNDTDFDDTRFDVNLSILFTELPLLDGAAAGYGIRVLDAPVSGGEAGAVEAVLSIMVGGERADFDEARPVFDALGRTIVLCGPHGSGQTVKAANQLIVAVNIQAWAEAVVFLEKSGVDLHAALEVLGGGLAGSTVLARKKGNFLSRDFTPGFRVDLHHKDMGIVTASLRARGDGGLDHSALLRRVQRLSGPRRLGPRGTGRPNSPAARAFPVRMREHGYVCQPQPRPGAPKHGRERARTVSGLSPSAHVHGPRLPLRVRHAARTAAAARGRAGSGPAPVVGRLVGGDAVPGLRAQRPVAAA